MLATFLAPDAPPAAIHIHHSRDLVIGVLLLTGAILVSYFAHLAFFWIAGRIRKEEVQHQTRFLPILKRLREPARLLVIVSALLLVIPSVPFIAADLSLSLRKGLGVVWFVGLGWLLIKCVYIFEDVLVGRYDMGAEDNLRARRVRTQLQLLRRLAITLIVLLDIGLTLSIFRESRIWQYGAGLIASAGLASLALATAAKSTVGNLLAGLQIAISEPIRIDDVVIVEGEWGKIEEITTSYVVIKIWDLRRLIVPLSYFIEKPFQNWTREKSSLLGTAFLYVDYTVDVEAVRQKLSEVVAASPLWDREVCGLQVTNLTETSMELRCLVSARNASEQFDLRCVVREQMVAFLHEQYPDAFPTARRIDHITADSPYRVVRSIEPNTEPGNGSNPAQPHDRPSFPAERD